MIESDNSQWCFPIDSMLLRHHNSRVRGTPDSKMLSCKHRKVYTLELFLMVQALFRARVASSQFCCRYPLDVLASFGIGVRADCTHSGRATVLVDVDVSLTQTRVEDGSGLAEVDAVTDLSNIRDSAG